MRDIFHIALKITEPSAIEKFCLKITRLRGMLHRGAISGWEGMGLGMDISGRDEV